MPVKTRIIKIGNSQGIRIPKPLLEESGLDGDVELVVGVDSIVIHAISEPRLGWGPAFAEMADQDEDGLLDPDVVTTEWDGEEWEWE